MTCRSVREAMWQLADLDPADAAQQFPEASAHLQTCATCRARLALIARVAEEDAAGDYGPPAFTPRLTIALDASASSKSSESSASSNASERRIVLMGDTDDADCDPHSVPRIALRVALRGVALALHLSVDGAAARASASPMICIVTLRAVQIADDAASAQASASASASASAHGHALEAREGEWTAWPDEWPAVAAGSSYLLRIEPQPASGVTYRVILDIAL